MKIKVGSPRYFMILGLITGLFCGVFIAFGKGSLDKKVADFIFYICCGLGAGTFIGLLINAGTNFKAGLRAALYGGLLFSLGSGLHDFISGIPFFIWFSVNILVTVSMIITLSLVATLFVRLRRTKFCQKLERGLLKKK